MVADLISYGLLASIFVVTGLRMFVEKPIFDEFVEKFVGAAKKLVVGDPLKDETQLGPLVSAGQRTTVESFIADARSSGSKFLSGGGRPHAKGYYLEPTILPKPTTLSVWGDYEKRDQKVSISKHWFQSDESDGE